MGEVKTVSFEVKITDNTVDTIPLGTTFVSNSITVNSNPVSGNVENGVMLPDIAINETITVKYRIVVN